MQFTSVSAFYKSFLEKKNENAQTYSGLPWQKQDGKNLDNRGRTAFPVSLFCMNAAQNLFPERLFCIRQGTTAGVSRAQARPEKRILSGNQYGFQVIEEDMIFSGFQAGCSRDQRKFRCPFGNDDLPFGSHPGIPRFPGEGKRRDPHL